MLDRKRIGGVNEEATLPPRRPRALVRALRARTGRARELFVDLVRVLGLHHLAQHAVRARAASGTAPGKCAPGRARPACRSSRRQRAARTALASAAAAAA